MGPTIRCCVQIVGLRYPTLANLAGVDPADDWLDPTTNITHGIYGNVDMILDPCVTQHRLFTTLCAPCDEPTW